MASSSSASTSCSPPPWDVFINHRGPDVKRTFASYLYRSLVSKGLRVFLDKEELEAGQNIPCQIQQAIRGAAVDVAIFSETYAESTWCLDELVLMVESVKSGKIILPVFYKVQPSVLRHTVKGGAYAHALRKLEGKTAHDPETGEEKPRYNSDSFRKWRDALSFVADISGFVILDDDDEGELLDKVVESVVKSVPKPLLDVAKYPTGLNQKLEEFETTVLQKQETNCVEAKVVGIWGVGGVGKTTLAKEFFNVSRSYYNKSCFLFDVRENISKKTVTYLQNKLLKDLTGLSQEIESRDEGVGILRKYLSSCHALIVVDDLDDVSQMEELLPRSLRAILNPDSLILATSRDKHVLKRSGVLESSIYNMKGLSQLHSTELFCCYALNQPSPSQEFADLTDRFVKACDGLPLLLRVLGALVCGRCESYWEATLDRGLSNTEIEKSLKISYDSLSEEDQEIFLDIASFFIGEKKDVAIRIWGWPGFQNLQDKCLLDVDAENSIRMHDHIRDLARKIAQGSGTRRLWQQSTEDIDDLLELSSLRMTEVRGITMRSDPQVAVTMGIPRRKRKRHSGSCGIWNLEFVATERRCLERILEKARSPNLRWVRWYICPYSSLPSWIPMKKLRVLEVAGDELETLWQEESEPPRQLRELRVWAGSSFSKFPKSIGQLKYLEKITISTVEHVSSISLPEEFCELPCLKYLDLGNCTGITSLPDSFGRLTRLQHIKLNGAYSLRTLPESFGNLNQLKSLDLPSCYELAFSGTTLGNITTLEYLDISDCHNVTELPTQLEHQLSLKELHMGGPNLKELPSWIGNLCNLERLHLVRCGIEHLPQELMKMNNLLYLQVWGCPLLELPFKRIEEERELNKMESFYDDDKCLFALKEIFLSHTKISEVFFSGCVCPNLQSLVLVGCKELTQIGGLCGLSKLQRLRIYECRKLTQIGGLCGLSKLQCLVIYWSDRLEELPNLEMLISLETLDVSCCEKLRSIPGLGQLKKLRRLHVEECPEMLELSGAKHLMLLKELCARGCPKLRWLEGELEQLRPRLQAGLRI